MLKKIALGIALLVVAVLVFAATRPGTMHVERSATINAPVDEIFALVNDFKSWKDWSPWEKLDTAMVTRHSGAASGDGAIYEWEGNSDVGKGRMEIVESTTSGINIKLDFLEPFEAHNMTLFTFAPQGDATTVTWAMDGPSPYISKLMGVFVDMDDMIGKDFETGLGNLKMLAER
jgi:hypothetical protein